MSKEIKTIQPYRITVKREIMLNIYYEDGVQPSVCVHTCSTLKEAKNWVNKQLKGYTMIDADHPCTKDDYQSSKTALYQVFDEEPNFAELVFESDYFYAE